jgi:Lon protease-like protein
MDSNADSRASTIRCRLFPLPEVVLLPHTLVPLHIFEPRYRQMTEDALADDQLVTMIKIRPSAKGQPWVEPVPLMEVGCLGKIVRHERLPDGRFNFLLLGISRVRLTREIDSGKLYRIAEAEEMPDIVSGPTQDVPQIERTELVEMFRAVLKARRELDDDLLTFLNSPEPLGILTDIMAQALTLPSETKQDLLAEPNVERRVSTLWTILSELLGHNAASRIFPPRFSAN